MKRFQLALAIIVLLFLCGINVSVFAHEGEHCDCCTCHHGTKPPKEIVDGTVLTIQDCISIGLKNSPVIKKRKYALDIAKSNVGIAKSVYFPTIGAGVGYGQLNNSNNKEFHSIYRELPNVGVSLRQMIWDFGRSNANIKMEEFYKIGAEYEFMDSVCSTVFFIKTKYYALLRAYSLLETQKMDLDINTILINDIKSMVNSGKANRIDLLNAEIEQLKIKNKILEAQDELKNAKEDLNNSMYFLNAPDYKIQETLSFNDNYRKYCFPYKLIRKNQTVKIPAEQSKSENFIPKFSYEEAIDIAYKNSPDLQVLISTKNAMEQSLLAIKRSYFPELSANVGYGRLSTNHFNNNELSVGVNLTADLNAMNLKHSIKGGVAQVELAKTEIDKFKEDLYFQVRKALNIVNKTQAQIPISKEQLLLSSDALCKTIERYKQGQMDQLELIYARNMYNKSMEDYVNSIYRYNIAIIDLEISMHYHLIDLHDRTEHAIKYHDEEIINNFDNIMDCDKHDHKHKNK